MFRRLSRNFRRAIPEFDPTSPELGNLPMIVEQGSLFNFITNSFKHFNSDIFTYWAGPIKTVALGNPKYMKAVSKLTSKHPKEVRKFYHIVGENSILLANPPEHTRMKQYFYPIFAMKNIRDHHY